MGLNPGGETGTGPRLQESIDASLSRTVNAYLVPWENGVHEHDGDGDSPLQRRVQWLFQQLGYDLKRTLCTNLVFLQSKNEKGITWDDANDCWPVHEAMLSIVEPRLILVYGNSGFSPYGFLHSRYGGEQCFMNSGHGNWNLKAFKAKINGRDTAVIGLPHLSKYDPTSSSRSNLVIKFIQDNR